MTKTKEVIKRFIPATWRSFMRLAPSDFLKWITFTLNTVQRKSLETEFRLCQDIEDYVDFALQKFETIQKREEIISFLHRVQEDSPKRICEIGTYNGGTNFIFSHALHSVNMMIGIDLYVQNRFLLRFFHRIGKNLYFINGPSCNPNTLRKVEGLLDGHKIDLLFIDGNHSYDGVKEDFVKYRSYVRRGGLIAFHDINPSNFLRNGVKSEGYVGGVPVFWAKIKLVYPFYEFISDPNQDGLGLGLIKYSPEIDASGIFI